MTEDELRNMLRKPGCRKANPQLLKHYAIPQANGELCHPQPQCNQAPTLDPPVPGKTKSVPRPVVRFVGYRRKLLDPENFSAGVKDLLDGLRHAGLIRGDGYEDIVLETDQWKVKTKAEERTEIEIIYLP